MELLAGMRSWLYAHRHKIVMTGLAVGGSVALLEYLRHQAQDRREEEALECFERSRRNCHFESIEITCQQTIILLGQKLEQRIDQLSTVSSIVADMKSTNSQQLDQWNLLKIASFTDLCLVIYADTLLAFLLKVQFAVMGGTMYRGMTGKSRPMSKTLQEKYLQMLSSQLMNEGLSDLCTYIRSKVDAVIHDIPLNQKFSMHNLQELFWSIQTAIDTSMFIAHISQYLALENAIKETTEKSLKEMYEETRSIVECSELNGCLVSQINNGFEIALDQLHEQCTRGGSSCQNADVISTSTKQLPLAKVLPMLSRILKYKESSKMDSLLWIVSKCSAFETLCANVYESFC